MVAFNDGKIGVCEKKKLWGLSRDATNATTLVMKTWNSG